MHVSIDEHQYLKNALLVQDGSLKSADPLSYCGGSYNGDDYLSNYHIGKSLSLIPFTWFTFPFAMLSGLVVHLLNLFLFVLILRRLGANPWLSVLFAFYPAFLWESRTLFSETWALSFLLGGVYFYLAKSPSRMALAGFLFGLAALVRYETVLISGSFAAGALWNHRHSLFTRWNPAHFFIAGGLVSALVLLGWNAWYYGNPFSTQFGSPSQLFTSFPQPLFVNNLVSFVGILLLAYPLLLLSPLRSRALKIELILASILTLGLFAQTTNISVYPFLSPLTLTGRMRYFIPLAGLLLIPYAEVLSRMIPRVVRRVGSPNVRRAGIALFILFLAGGLALHATHQSLVDKREAVREQILSTIPDGSLVVGSSDDCIYFLPLYSGDRRYGKVDDSHQDILGLLSGSGGKGYVMQLVYSNASESDIRQGVIDKERMAMASFIEDHHASLTPVFTTQVPHHLTIYQWK